MLHGLVRDNRIDMKTMRAFTSGNEGRADAEPMRVDRMPKKQSRSRGFTLIELIVVVGIIALLSSVVLTAVGKARLRAQDSERIANLQQVRTAAEFYANANGGKYPNSGGDWISQCSSWGQTTANNAIPGLTAGGFMKQLPTDTQQNVSADTCCYLYVSGDTDPGDGGTRNYKYMLYNCPTSYACYQNTSPMKPYKDPARNSSCAVYTSGASAW